MDSTEAIACGRTEEGCLQPSDAFSLLGDETRVRILEALWESEDTPMSFARIFEAVPVDSSSQFNYHLQQLTGPFVRKRTAGYELRTAGEHVMRALVAGSFNAHPTIDPFELASPCTRCEATLVATYADETLAIECPACGFGHGRFGFPPGGLLDRERAEILSAFDRRVRHRHRLAADGVCPACSGRIRPSIRDRDGEREGDNQVLYTCQQCRYTLRSTVGLSLLDRAPVVGFLRDHGRDAEDVPYWHFEWCVSDDAVSVHEREPWRLSISIEVDGDRLEAMVDGDLQLREATPA